MQILKTTSFFKLGLLVGCPDLNQESIEPKEVRIIDWEAYKQFLFSKYVKSYALALFEHSQKYLDLLEDANGIQLTKPTARNNIINVLTALSKYLGHTRISSS